MRTFKTKPTGRPSTYKWTAAQLIRSVNKATSCRHLICLMFPKTNPGYTRLHEKLRADIARLKLDISHWRMQPKSDSDVFRRNSKVEGKVAKARILSQKLIPYHCNWCKLEEWRDRLIVLQLDHINGNNKDHRLINLRLLCPNCHSQTETYAGRKPKDI